MNPEIRIEDTGIPNHAILGLENVIVQGSYLLFSLIWLNHDIWAFTLKEGGAIP